MIIQLFLLTPFLLNGFVDSTGEGSSKHSGTPEDRDKRPPKLALLHPFPHLFHFTPKFESNSFPTQQQQMGSSVAPNSNVCQQFDIDIDQIPDDWFVPVYLMEKISSPGEYSQIKCQIGDVISLLPPSLVKLLVHQPDILELGRFKTPEMMNHLAWNYALAAGIVRRAMIGTAGEWQPPPNTTLSLRLIESAPSSSSSFSTIPPHLMPDLLSIEKLFPIFDRFQHWSKLTRFTLRRYLIVLLMLYFPEANSYQVLDELRKICQANSCKNAITPDDFMPLFRTLFQASSLFQLFGAAESVHELMKAGIQVSNIGVLNENNVGPKVTFIYRFEILEIQEKLKELSSKFYTL